MRNHADSRKNASTELAHGLVCWISLHPASLEYCDSFNIPELTEVKISWPMFIKISRNPLTNFSSQNDDISLTPLNPVRKSSNSELDEQQANEPESEREETLPPQQEWTRGVLFCAYGTSFVLLLNIILAAIAMSRTYGIYKSELSEASALYKGDCSKSKGWATGLHVIINGLSTIMLAATNYCMQCLGAPSRADIDSAHAQQRWLDIGTPSIRNLRFFGRRHIILWLLLLVTSLPIHLLLV